MLIGGALITSATFSSLGHDFSNKIRGITTEIEGIKLDAVVMERKFNLIADQNKQSIDKFKMQLSNLEAIPIRESMMRSNGQNMNWPVRRRGVSNLREIYKN